MAFESSDKSGLNNGRKVRLDISNINQSGLKGDTVYTDEELLQLIIDNVSKMEVPTGTQDSNKDGKVDVNDLIFNVSESFKRYAKTQSDKVTLPNLIEALTNGIAVLHSDLSVQAKVAQGLQKNLDIANRQEKGEKNPLLYSSGLKAKDRLHPIADIVRETEKEFVQQKNITGDTTNLAKTISHEPADLQSPIVEYLKKPQPNSRTLADTVANLWILVDDLRKAVRSVVYDLDTALRVARMGGVKTFFSSGADCVQLLSTAKAMDHNHGASRDVWNETGVLFDPTVHAYNSNNPTPSAECITNTWYCVVGKEGGTIGQYSSTVPHWRNVGTVCPPKKAEYTNSTSMDDLL